ncbi:MAG: peptidoglycan-binding protein [Mesorhizobium sp.]|nr:MAG: peptidoglycan-binding protein [Mesorhizobium sp.]
MAQPVFSPDGYTLAWDRPIGESKGGPYLLYSDKTEQLGQQVYTSLAPPHDFLPIRSGRLMLALFPSRQKASLIDVSIGEALDSISVFGLHFRDPTHYAVFAPDAVDGGTGDVVVANADVEALTVLSVEKDSRSTRLSAPLQITLENLPALRKGNRRVLLGANKDLSVILVGAIGDPELSVFRKSGGGLEELAPVTLPEPIQDMVVLPRQPPTGDEAVALLGSAGDRLFVLADIQELATSHTVDQQGNLITAELTRENIRLIQKVLAELGYSIGSIDGLLGPRTDAAIRAFQLANGIAVSGSVDEPTLTALNRKADSVLQP